MQELRGREQYMRLGNIAQGFVFGRVCSINTDDLRGDVEGVDGRRLFVGKGCQLQKTEEM